MPTFLQHLREHIDVPHKPAFSIFRHMTTCFSLLGAWKFLTYFLLFIDSYFISVWDSLAHASV